MCTISYARLSAVDRTLQNWNKAYALDDDTLVIYGKTMCNAIDDQGYQAHIMSAVGHQTKGCYTQKKYTMKIETVFVTALAQKM